MTSFYPDFDLYTRNTFRMRVRCALYVEITEEADLPALDWAALPQPVLVMGGGSNLLFTKDFPGTVLHYAEGTTFSGGKGRRERSERSPAEGSTFCHVTVPAGVVFDEFCAWAAEEGLWGPENLSLIPGEVGASAVQNIGAYGVEAKDIIADIRAWDRQEGRFVHIDPASCAYGYRTSKFKTEWKGRYLITAVTYRLSREPRPVLDYGGIRKALEVRGMLPGTCPPPDVGRGRGPLPEAVGGAGAERSEAEFPGSIPLTPKLVRDTIIDIRRQKLPDPAEVGSAGSFFCNPVIGREHFERIQAAARSEKGPDYAVPHFDTPDGVKVPAAWMIEQCGFKGVRNGGAQVYQNQPLVIVNESGSATPEDIIGLERQIISAVRDRFAVTLHPEVEHV